MACEDQINTQDLINAKTDATTLGEVATSRSGAESGGTLIDTSINRFGETTDTVTGRLKKMGYAVPLNYAGGISFSVNDNVKTVDESSIVYAPLPSALPFTTSGTFVGDGGLGFFAGRLLCPGIADRGRSPPACAFAASDHCSSTAPPSDPASSADPDADDELQDSGTQRPGPADRPGGSGTGVAVVCQHGQPADGSVVRLSASL